MLSITSELGRAEELFSEVVYPVWPLWLAAALLLVAALGYVAYRRGWHRAVASHPLLTSVTVAVILAIAAPIGWYTVSPLFERNTVCEASPIPGADAGSDECDDVAFAATMPPTASPTPAPTQLADATDAPVTTPAPTEAPAPTPFAAREVTRGVWQSADDFHFTNGDALLIETAPGVYTLRVENFSVRNGPDVYVLLSPTNGYTGEALNLGSLKGTDGAFNYDVPAGTDITQYKSAIIWCKQFDVLFGYAELM